MCGGACEECQKKHLVDGEQTHPVRRKSVDRDSATLDMIPVGAGRPLDSASRDPLESFFQADLTDVRIHTDSVAAESAASIDALAYSSGRDIYFAPGMYSPSSSDGQRLLAHEITHVVQQSAGMAPTVAAKSSGHHLIGDPDDPLEAEADRVAQAFLNGQDLAELERKRLLPQSSSSSAQDSVQRSSTLRSLSWGPSLSAPIQRQVGPQPRGAFSEADLAVMRQWLDNQDQFPTATSWNSKYFDSVPRLTGLPFKANSGSNSNAIVSDVCPSCHQTPAELREAARKRQIEWEEKQRQQQREASWPGMHLSQHKKELDNQDKTLLGDIQTSELTAGQLRVQMFDRILTSGSPQAGSGPGNSAALTQEMRDSWSLTQQTTVVLEALLRASQEDLPAYVTAPFRSAYVAFYASIGGIVRHFDLEEERFFASLPTQLKAPVQCPGGCHQPSNPTSFANLTAGGPPQPPVSAPLLGSAAIGKSSGGDSLRGGPRTTRLNQSIGRADTANSNGAWRAVVADFRWATEQMDRLLLSRLTMDSASKDLLEQFEYTQDMLARQKAFMEANPEALKVQAIFYPKNEFITRTDEHGAQREVAKGIPWQFYLTRTPVRDSRSVPIGFEWQLHDITAPHREDRVVRHHQVNAIEALIRERTDPLPILQMDPPSELFEGLNDRDFFPKGVLYWYYPLSHKPGALETTASPTFGDWLIGIGMTVAILGSLVFAPLSTPMLIAVALGTGLGIAGRISNLAEKQEHGALTQADLNRFYWDLGLDVISALTMGFGRVAATAERAGNLLRAASASRAWMVVRRVQVIGDVVNVGIITHDLIDQYQAIQNSSMNDDQKRSALIQLTVFATASGFFSIVALRSGMHDLSRRPRLSLDVDPGNPSTLIADLESAVEKAGAPRPRVNTQAKVLEGISITHPDTGETHNYAIWSDGRITRCSPGPCPDIAESVVTRLQDLRSRMLSDSQHLEQLEELMGRARRLQIQANRVAEGTATELKANRVQFLSRTREIEEEIVLLERGVGRENVLSDRTGREEAQRRFGDAALDYNPSHYRWVRNRNGNLVFERRSLAVPWLEFDEAAKKFKVSRSLFVPVSPQRQQEIRETSVTKDFPVLQTVDNIADLRRLRPSSATVQAHPGNWVVVRITDENLIHFIDEPVAHGVIFEFPDGSRVWRTPENTIATEGALRGSIGRRGFEQTTPPQLREDESGSNLGVPLLEKTGVDHQRAHPRGQGTGFELFNHIPFAPTYVNQQLQARGIELFLSKLHKQFPNMDFRLSTVDKVIPNTRRMAWIDYHLDVVTPSGRRSLMNIRIGVDYTNKLKPAEVEMRQLTTNEADLALFDSINMPEALAELQNAIKSAKARRLR